MAKEGANKVIILLLILAIIFSTVSILIGLSAIKVAPQKNPSSQLGSSLSSTVGFFVETPPRAGGAG